MQLLDLDREQRDASSTIIKKAIKSCKSNIQRKYLRTEQIYSIFMVRNLKVFASLVDLPVYNETECMIFAYTDEDKIDFSCDLWCNRGIEKTEEALLKEVYDFLEDTFLFSKNRFEWFLGAEKEYMKACSKQLPMIKYLR